MNLKELYKTQTHSTTIGGVERCWKITDLWDLAANLPVRNVYPTDLPEFEHLMDCQAGDIWWSRERGIKGDFRMWDMRRHCELVMKADLDYPIILNPLGGLMDGAQSYEGSDLGCPIEGCSVHRVAGKQRMISGIRDVCREIRTG